MLRIKLKSISVGDKEIIKNVDINIKPKTINLIYGNNGIGKTSLIRSIINSGNIHKQGEITIDSLDITNLQTHEIIQKGIYFSQQHPIAITGVNTLKFLREQYMLMEYISEKIDLISFRREIIKLCKDIDLNIEVLDRDLHVGFSGGESKKLEIIQLQLLKPRYAILDEIDTGLDIQSKSRLISVVSELKNMGTTFIIVSHNKEIWCDLIIDNRYLIQNGTIIKK